MPSTQPKVLMTSPATRAPSPASPGWLSLRCTSSARRSVALRYTAGELPGDTSPTK